MWYKNQFEFCLAKNGKKPNLSGKSVGDKFLYCENCGHQRDQFPDYWARQCPECLTLNVVQLTVTEEDVIENKS